MRAFVLGNGPSLNETPLERLIGEATFAVNRIHLIYPKTRWRPSVYVRAEEMAMPDPDVWKEDLIANLEDPEVKEIWCNQWFVKWLDRVGYKVQRDVNIIKACAHYTEHFDSPNAPHLWHLPLLCTFGSSVNVAIQIAVMKGYSPIYLLGCDLGDMRHFDPDYQKGYTGQLRPPRYALMDTLHAHMVAARSSPVKIYNATPGGTLEAYERVRLDDIL